MIKRGFPQDLPARPAHALQLDWWVTQRNFINIWLPEGVFTDATNILWFLLRDPTDLRWSRDAGGAWEGRFTLKDRCEVVTRSTEREDGVDFQMRLTNRSAATWPNARMIVCVQLAAACDFRDPGLERTFYRGGGAWKKFDPGTVKRTYPGGCHFYGGMNQTQPGEFERGEIRVASRCGQWHLSLAFREAVAVGGNCHESICCIHADPILGRIKPGETKEARGWLRARNEPVDASCHSG